MTISIPRLASRVLQHPDKYLSTAFFFTAALSKVANPIRHSLFVSAISWLSIYLYTWYRSKSAYGGEGSVKRRLAWRGGGFLALSQLCARAAADREGLWWLTSLCPGLIFIDIRFPTRVDNGTIPLDLHFTAERNIWTVSGPLLILLTITAVIATNATYITATSLALCFCSIFFTSQALVCVANATEGAPSDPVASQGYTTPVGDISKLESPTSKSGNHVVVLRDLSSVLFVVCGIGSIFLENSTSGEESFPRVLDLHNGIWNAGSKNDVLYRTSVAVLIQALENLLIFKSVARLGSLRSSLISVAACILARMITDFSNQALVFGTAFALLFFASLNQSATSIPPCANFWRSGKSRLAAIVASVCLAVYHGATLVSPEILVKAPSFSELGIAVMPAEPYKPLPVLNVKVHPVSQLVRAAETDLEIHRNRQSKSLEQATAEYRRRYQLHPPPNFDKWFLFARRKGIELIDEFDTIHDSLLPFWGLTPSSIRSRTREALGNNDNQLIALTIRDGKPILIEGGEQWQQDATLGMIESFVQYLPDMDLAFNIHDEPRVVLPHDKLSKLLIQARTESMAEAFTKKSPRNNFSPRPDDLGNGKRIYDVKRTRFNQFAHQETWAHSRLSCPLDSPARDYEETYRDNFTSYALGELGFIYNRTAFTDICNSPSFSEKLGFFVQPNAYNVVQDLMPIFSQSKVSSYQDILYPSPWYWAENVTYEGQHDVDWSEKAEVLYWRGSTTGGFSRNGNWRRQHRQRVVQALNGLDDATILAQQNPNDQASGLEWRPKTVPRAAYKRFFDVHFSSAQQCDPIDCAAQEEFFNVTEEAERADAFAHRHVLDIDGNAFSGRFYAFLESNSLVYKAGVFREWHHERLRPWVHYVPTSLASTETLELVRYFAEEEEGMEIAQRLARQGREWARSALRKEDMEVWFFRLLLEYGRVIDDNRESIGFAGS